MNGERPGTYWKTLSKPQAEQDDINQGNVWKVLTSKTVLVDEASQRPEVRSSAWVERIGKALQAISVRDALPIQLAIELQYAHDHLRAAKSCADKWMRSTGGDKLRTNNP